MININEYMTTPFGSIISADTKERDSLLKASFNMPKGIKEVMISSKTGAYVRGLTRQHGLSEKESPLVALLIFKVALGMSKIGELSALLEGEGLLKAEKANQMAAEIEKDLFEPVREEWGEYLRNRNKETKKSAGEQQVETRRVKMRPVEPKPAGPPVAEGNVLDLNKTKKPPLPPPMPGGER